MLCEPSSKKNLCPPFFGSDLTPFETTPHRIEGHTSTKHSAFNCGELPSHCGEQDGVIYLCGEEGAVSRGA